MIRCNSKKCDKEGSYQPKIIIPAIDGADIQLLVGLKFCGDCKEIMAVKHFLLPDHLPELRRQIRDTRLVEPDFDKALLKWCYYDEALWTAVRSANKSHLN